MIGACAMQKLQEWNATWDNGEF